LPSHAPHPVLPSPLYFSFCTLLLPCPASLPMIPLSLLLFPPEIFLCPRFAFLLIASILSASTLDQLLHVALNGPKTLEEFESSGILKDSLTYYFSPKDRNVKPPPASSTWILCESWTSCHGRLRANFQCPRQLVPV
jgi:hypothetical protein